VCRQLARRGLVVVLTSRDEAAGREAAADLGREGAHVRVERLDVGSRQSVAECAGRLQAAGVHVDVLINNAAIYPPGGVLATPADTWEQALHTNLLGAVWTCEAFVPAMLRAGYGRIVNVSSGSGSFDSGLGGPAAYAVSKAALNALTKKLASELAGDVKANAVCPGWVRTQMGGRAAPLSVEEGADTIVWLATLPASGPTGGFFRKRRRIAW
jgi:NAD(P)-dependent dehydrogenase (short-subunit alcohol dehydrogenase family)